MWRTGRLDQIATVLGTTMWRIRNAGRPLCACGYGVVAGQHVFHHMLVQLLILPRLAALTPPYSRTAFSLTTFDFTPAPSPSPVHALTIYPLHCSRPRVQLPLMEMNPIFTTFFARREPSFTVTGDALELLAWKRGIIFFFLEATTLPFFYQKKKCLL